MLRGPSLLLVSSLALWGCGAGASRLPLTALPPPEPASSAVFAGWSTAYRLSQGAWLRAPGYDYDFTVLVRRYPRRWDVVKEVHRRSPDYDGLAGPRDQTLHFEVDATPTPDGGSTLAVRGTLGSGTGREEPDGRLVLEIASASRGWFVPFDSIRIRQEPPDAEGRIRETVELFSRKKGREAPFMRMEESGRLYRPGLRAEAPGKD